MSAILVWNVHDIVHGQKFYEAVLDISMIKEDNTALPNPMVWFQDPKTPGTLGHLYPGKPASDGSGNTVHILSTDPLEDVMPRVEKAGGKVVSPIIPLPVGRFVYITDPDGNSVGLFNWTHE
ncbi:MAG: VOC family protein [Pseudomonadota bacterium]